MIRIVMLLVGSLVVTPCLAQTPKPATPKATAPAAKSPGYRLTRKDGKVYVIKSYAIDGKFYRVTDVKGSLSQHWIDSVESIEPLTEEELAKASGEYKAKTSVVDLPSKVRTTPRTSARTSARTTTDLSESQIDAFDLLRKENEGPTDSNGLGSTPTGFQLYRGPRGGIYHYSKNGNKVYQKKK